MKLFSARRVIEGAAAKATAFVLLDASASSFFCSFAAQSGIGLLDAGEQGSFCRRV